MFTAGYNMPGCLPENDPQPFDSFAEAVTYLDTVIDRFWDEDSGSDFCGDIDNADVRWLPIHTALHNLGKDDIYFTGSAGGFAFWITPAVQ